MLIIFAENVYYLYVSQIFFLLEYFNTLTHIFIYLFISRYLSRFFSGFVGGAVFVVIPLMVTEIAEDSIRGALSTILVIINIKFEPV